MNKLRVAVILTLFLSAVPFSACGGGNKNANLVPPQTAPIRLGENANSAKTNVEELGILVNVPYEAKDVVWKEDSANKKVIAVFRFSPADANKIVAEAEKTGARENVSVAVEIWFPDELTAQSDMSGDSSLKGLAYPANAFFQEPYTSGKIIRIEGGDYFVLELSAKGS
ncbi:MAG: hypothetical protein ABIP78_05670 [Pyrinomonadaceae bacterium]